VRVRNRGTIGGSLAHADHTSEIGCCALATGAQVVVRGPAEDGQSERTIPVSELFAGYWTTTLASAEIITDVLIPVARPWQGWSFHEMVRRTSDFAIVAVAVMVDVDERTGAITTARVALAGVADRVVLADSELFAELTGSTADTDLDAAAARVAERLEPADDVHASGEYRRRLARVLTARALRQACARAAAGAS
jgi:aerobic carbon-monoxide dehydrogenase medium subunit